MWNVGQGHWVIVHGYQQLLCKVWHSFPSCRETDFNASVDVKLGQSHWSVKCRSRTPGHSACWNGYDMNNYYARFDTHSYHSCRETDFNASVDIKLGQSHWSVKCRSRTPGHSACWNGYDMNNYYARFDTHSNHNCRETDFYSRVDIKLW